MSAAATPRTAKAPVSSDAIRAAVNTADCLTSLALGPSKSGEHCWSQLDAETFQVRGPRYLTDKSKVPAAPSAFDLMHVEIFTSNEKIGNVAGREDSFLRKARAAGDTRFYYVVTYVTPAAPYIHLCIYYAVDDAKVAASPQLSKLWRQFTAEGPEGDAFRNDRWKVIPRIAEGSWIVSNAVGTKPALLAQKLTHTWIICNDEAPTGTAGAAAGAASAAGATAAAAATPAAAAAAAASGGAAAGDATPRTVETTDAGCGTDFTGRARGESYVIHTGPGPYMEADCDVASSSIAYMLVSLLQQYAKYIVIDLGFAIEPRTDEECPEIVLGTLRLSRLDVTKPPLVKAKPGDWVLGALGVTHGEADDGDDE